MISLTDIGYAAGFYEGEGSFSYSEGKTPFVSITQKDPEPLVKLQKLFGGEINPYGGYNYWRLHGVEARGFILTIFSLLSVRRKQQILKHKEFFITPDACPNRHPYTENSYRMVNGRKGKVKQCRICHMLNMAKHNKSYMNLLSELADEKLGEIRKNEETIQ